MAVCNEIDCTEGGKTYTVEAENEPTKGYIRVVKTDALDGVPIAGVQFDLYDASGNPAGSMTTDETGLPCPRCCTKADIPCASMTIQRDMLQS